MEETKIQFSVPEIELMCNASVILTKNKVMEGIRKMLEQLQQQMQLHAGFMEMIPGFSLQNTPKISRGENYRGLPYLILDYPRQFENDNIFAIRTLFWWGSFFSITLHLSGSAKERWLDKIVKAYPVLSAHDFHIGINEDPWQHHFDEGNYHAISDIQEEVYAQYCRRFEHLKIAARFDLRSVHEVSPLLLKNWKLLMEICYADQAPSL